MFRNRTGSDSITPYKEYEARHRYDDQQFVLYLSICCRTLDHTLNRWSQLGPYAAASSLR